MEYNFKMLKVKSQTETECECRVIMHMYIASISAGITELKKRLQELNNTTNISRHCREWVYYAMKNPTSLKPFQSDHSFCSIKEKVSICN